MNHYRTAPVLAALLLATAACGGGDDDGGGAKKGGTLTLAVQSAPASFDPAKANVGTDNATVNLAYDTLIRFGAGGRLEPDLATSWKYVGTGNKVFELTLREGVKFADGTPMDAKAVAASLDYVRKNGLNVSWTAAISSVTATGPLTVRIECSSPHPVLPRLLSNVQLVGSVISPAGLADPARLGTKSFGAGPYVLDPAATVSGDHYTYTPNPNYWDQSKIKWGKVIVKVITNSQTAVQAVKSGQVDFGGFTADAAGAAKAAGLSVVNGAGAAFFGINLADRAGTLAPQLKDLRVRQALNHAVDRAAIAKALFQGYGQPTTQATTPGQDGFDPALDEAYPYDPAKAKKLLADAGYPNGFELPMETQGFFGINLITQAVVDQWQKVGVKVKLTTDTTTAAWLRNVTSGKYPSHAYGYGGLPTYLLAQDWYLPQKTAFNPFASTDPAMAKLLSQGAAAAESDQTAIYRQVTRHAVDQAWYVGIARTDVIYGVGPKISGFTIDEKRIFPDVAWDIAPR